MTLLKRLGNKDQIADKIIKYFPPHKYYIEMFFGAGGVFFNKPKVSHSILNDLDKEVFNLYMVVRDKPEELIEQIELMPLDQNLFNHWKLNKETNDVLKAVRFLMLNNFSFMGTSNSMGNPILPLMVNQKKYLIKRLPVIKVLLNDVCITNKDFRKLLTSIAFDKKIFGREANQQKDTFIYADPPYINTINNYNIAKWTEQDTIDLFDILVNSGIRFAISERNDPFILDLAKQHNLEVIHIMSKRALSRRHNEILIVNYEPERQLNLFE